MQPVVGLLTSVASIRQPYCAPIQQQLTFVRVLLLLVRPQEFLQRAELREYELERDKRLASDVRLRGRL